MTDEVADAIDRVVRDEGRRVLATLVRTTGSLELAEEAVADATERALRHWPRHGVPDEPRAWLTTVARRRAIDLVRADSRRRNREAATMTDEPVPDDGADLLRLLFTCCHPALSVDRRVALALRTLCGLSTHEIAAALMVAEPTLARRLVRARRKIADARIPYRVPGDDELGDRLPALIQVVRLVFTEGHRATSGDELVRVDLCVEAIHLASLLVELFPRDTEVAGLWALLTAVHARARTRTDAAGDVVLLRDQDRSRWDHDVIALAEAGATDAWARAGDSPGPVLVEAAIAVLHATAPTYAATDWRAITELYELLDAATANPAVRCNRAVAVAEWAGPAAGLALLDEAPTRTPDHLWDAVRADLLTRLGRRDDAAVAYRAALASGPPPPERRLLERRLADLATG